MAARVFPRVLASLRRYPDLFLLVSIAGGLVGAGIGAVVFGIPLALAAFVAGLVIADSPMAGEARRRLLPFRDVFAVLFFVAVGFAARSRGPRSAACSGWPSSWR